MLTPAQFSELIDEQLRAAAGMLDPARAFESLLSTLSEEDRLGIDPEMLKMRVLARHAFHRRG